MAANIIADIIHSSVVSVAAWSNHGIWIINKNLQTYKNDGCPLYAAAVIFLLYNNALPIQAGQISINNCFL